MELDETTGFSSEQEESGAPFEVDEGSAEVGRRRGRKRGSHNRPKAPDDPQGETPREEAGAEWASIGVTPPTGKGKGRKGKTASPGEVQSLSVTVVQMWSYLGQMLAGPAGALEPIEANLIGGATSRILANMPVSSIGRVLPYTAWVQMVVGAVMYLTRIRRSKAVRVSQEQEYVAAQERAAASGGIETGQPTVAPQGNGTVNATPPPPTLAGVWNND